MPVKTGIQIKVRGGCLDPALAEVTMRPLCRLPDRSAPPSRDFRAEDGGGSAIGDFGEGGHKPRRPAQRYPDVGRRAAVEAHQIEDMAGAGEDRLSPFRVDALPAAGIGFCHDKPPSFKELLVSTDRRGGAVGNCSFYVPRRGKKYFREIVGFSRSLLFPDVVNAGCPCAYRCQE